MIELNEAECREIYDLIDQLSGCNPDRVFAWNGSDDPAEPYSSALAKIYTAAGQMIPSSLLSLVRTDI